MNPTHADIASSWSLWTQYADPDCTMTRQEFDALALSDRLALLVEAFGPDTAQAPGIAA